MYEITKNSSHSSISPIDYKSSLESHFQKVPIQIKINDEFLKKASKPQIVAEGGRISLKNGTYFYVGKEVGPKSIEVFITLDSGQVYSDKVTFMVVE